MTPPALLNSAATCDLFSRSLPAAQQL